MKKTETISRHSDFRLGVYQKFLVMRVGKWYQLKSETLTMEEIINAFKYLIDIGYPLIFNNDFTWIVKEKSYKEILASFNQGTLKKSTWHTQQ